MVRIVTPGHAAVPTWRGISFSRLAIFAGFLTARARFRLGRTGGQGARGGGSSLAGLDGVVPIDVAQVPAGLDDIAYAALELLGLRKAAVGLAIPQDARLRLARSGGGGGYDVDDKSAASGGLKRDLAQGGREGREELLGVLMGGRERRGRGPVSRAASLSVRGEGRRRGAEREDTHGSPPGRRLTYAARSIHLHCVQKRMVTRGSRAGVGAGSGGGGDDDDDGGAAAVVLWSSIARQRDGTKS